MNHPPLTDEQRDMVADNLGLVGFVLTRYYPTHRRDDDAFQAGVEGLMRATIDFDLTLGKFSTYAVNWIRAAVSRGLDQFDGINSRRARANGTAYQAPLSLHYPLGDDGWTLSDVLADTDHDPAEVAIARARLDGFARALRHLAHGPLDRDVARRLLSEATGDPVDTYPAIAARHAVTADAVRRRLLQLRLEAAELLRNGVAA